MTFAGDYQVITTTCSNKIYVSIITIYTIMYAKEKSILSLQFRLFKVRYPDTEVHCIQDNTDM